MHVETPIDGINVYELAPAAGDVLPFSTPGAHIDLHLSNGMVRSYSLLNTGRTNDAYLVAVKRNERGKGGSVHIHDWLKPNHRLKISQPRNNFALNENASHSVLIAGGIGITPLWSMLHRLRDLGKSWELHYTCRAAHTALFHPFLAALSEVRMHFDEGDRGKGLSIEKIVSQAPADSDFYCCGPEGMLEAFRRSTDTRPQERVHFERFGAEISPVIAGNAFTVRLARSSKTINVAGHQTVLQALRQAGLNAPYSCEEGVCGACECTVLEGMPDHRDFVLSEAERLEGNKIMICCSRSKTGELVLDL